MSTTHTHEPQTAEHADTQGVLLTPEAANRVREIIKEQELNPDTVCLRVGVKGGGCSGFSYVLDLTESQKDTDEVFVRHGVKVICDPKSLLYLNGTSVHFKDEVMQSGFVFENPNSNGTCGCGSSFHV